MYLSFQVLKNFIPPLLEAVLIDYRSNLPAAREPEVLSTMATIVNKLEVCEIGPESMKFGWNNKLIT